MSEPVRPMPKPMITPEGHWEGRLFLSPESMDTRALFTLPSGPVIPIIVVPGIMGTNLRAKKHPIDEKERNSKLASGEAAWRAPNGVAAGIQEADKWSKRTPADRQNILCGPTLEVDDSGSIEISSESRRSGITPEHGRQRCWGEVHSDSYGPLLQALEKNFSGVLFNSASNGRIGYTPTGFWKRVMQCDPKRWGVNQIAPLTSAELEKVAHYQFPVYACGYNWLESNTHAASRLEQRINQVIEFWTSRKAKCERVILITHSMGGLVARACAKRIPGKIAGVVHGVMPALGAPVCYRRIACGTEGVMELVGGFFATIAGPTPESTTAVMATSPGALQLLPNHLYPNPWLRVGVLVREGTPPKERFDWLFSLPSAEDGNPYDLYRDFDSWYRLINPDFADPAQRYKSRQKLMEVIRNALDEAERFHVSELDQYYHPNSFAFYGRDAEQVSFGSVQWIARHYGARSGFDYNKSEVRTGEYSGQFGLGGRSVKLARGTLNFEPMAQDSSGDGTVPAASGNGPSGKVKQVFGTRGYGHQGSYQDEAMLMLTHYLIAKIVQAVQ